MSKKTRKKSSKTSSRKPARPAVHKFRENKAREKHPRGNGQIEQKRNRQSLAQGPIKTVKRLSKPAGSGPASSKAATARASAGKSPRAGRGREGAGLPPAARRRQHCFACGFLGKKLVLFFYPRADTPGCTREAIDFTRLTSAFAESRTDVLGISADPSKAQEAFRDKHKLSVPLISDERHEMLEAYGAWGEKSMYGRTFLGIIRTTVLIGADGRIIRVWRNVRVDGHAEAVLAGKLGPACSPEDSISGKLTMTGSNRLR